MLDATGVPVSDRELVRDAVSIAALCEVAEAAAGVEPDSARVASPVLLDELGAMRSRGRRGGEAAPPARSRSSSATSSAVTSGRLARLAAWKERFPVRR